MMENNLNQRPWFLFEVGDFISYFPTENTNQETYAFVIEVEDISSYSYNKQRVTVLNTVTKKTAWFLTFSATAGTVELIYCANQTNILDRIIHNNHFTKKGRLNVK